MNLRANDPTPITSSVKCKVQGEKNCYKSVNHVYGSNIPQEGGGIYMKRMK